jgi:GAF domain-containing protein
MVFLDVERFAEPLRRCVNVQSVLDYVLDRTLSIHDTRLGNVQLMNWNAGHLEIAAQRGFHDEFLNFFERVKIEDASACARALRNRGSVIIDDVLSDERFAPCCSVLRRAGISAVQSTPLVSSSGALVGMLSTHFSAPHRPTEAQMSVTMEAARLAANAIIRLRANARDDRCLRSSAMALLQQSRQAIANADKLLTGKTGDGRLNS